MGACPLLAAKAGQAAEISAAPANRFEKRFRAEA
jgi:hypothetical protein